MSNVMFNQNTVYCIEFYIIIVVYVGHWKKIITLISAIWPILNVERFVSLWSDILTSIQFFFLVTLEGMLRACVVRGGPCFTAGSRSCSV